MKQADNNIDLERTQDISGSALRPDLPGANLVKTELSRKYV